MKIHKSITLDRLMAAVEESMAGTEDMGFCVYCGEEAYGIEPDAERYDCEICEKSGVYGAEQLMLLTIA